jgi:GDP-L-galactose phosphorylase
MFGVVAVYFFFLKDKILFTKFFILLGLCLQMQACYFPSPLSVELTPVDTFYCDGWRGMRISAVTDYPIKTLLFEGNQKFKRMLEVLVEICYRLQEKSIPYNLLISDCGAKIFLFLQVTWPLLSF